MIQNPPRKVVPLSRGEGVGGEARKQFQKKKLLPYLLVSPYLLFVIVFVLFPVLFCFFLTFNKWNIIAPMKFHWA